LWPPQTTRSETLAAPLQVSRVIEILPGQYFDAETGLHQNWHRDYDPSIGRYLQSDPIGLLGGLNTYVYAESNPLIFVDLKGLSSSDRDREDRSRPRHPDSGNCGPQDISYCTNYCAEQGKALDGCYVQFKWRVKGLRGGNLIEDRERNVRCNCRDNEEPAPAQCRIP
jgi:RHS repeat-associated protein